MHTEAKTFCRYDCPMLFAVSWGRIPQLICFPLILQSLAVTPLFDFPMGDPKAQVSSGTQMRGTGPNSRTTAGPTARTEIYVPNTQCMSGQVSSKPLGI